MYKLEQNKYNKSLEKSQKKFKLWKSVGLMLTYKCSAQCRFCYYHCSPQNDGLMPVEMAINAWKDLKKLAGEFAKIHITGGEPFLYYDHLCLFLEQAKKSNLGSIDQLETNAGWVNNSTDAENKLIFLKKHDINTLKISCDPFHLEFVDIEQTKLLSNIGQKIFGKDRVLVRWQEYLDSPIDIKVMDEAQKADIFYSNYKKYPFRFTGNAAFELARQFENKPISNIQKLDCSKSFLASRGVHIDPFGNVFSGVCSGMILGNINETTLDSLWEKIDWQNMDFFDKLFAFGPFGFLQEAAKEGFQPQAMYAGKCQLCTHLRQFFFDKGKYKKIIGPKQCYNSL